MKIGGADECGRWWLQRPYFGAVMRKSEMGRTKTRVRFNPTVLLFNSSFRFNECFRVLWFGEQRGA